MSRNPNTRNIATRTPTPYYPRTTLSRNSGNEPYSQRLLNEQALRYQAFGGDEAYDYEFVNDANEAESEEFSPAGPSRGQSSRTLDGARDALTARSRMYGNDILNATTPSATPTRRVVGFVNTPETISTTVPSRTLNGGTTNATGSSNIRALINESSTLVPPASSAPTVTAPTASSSSTPPFVEADENLLNEEIDQVATATSSAKQTYGISEETTTYASVDTTKQGTARASVKYTSTAVPQSTASYSAIPLSTASIGNNSRTIENLPGFAKKLKQVLPAEKFKIVILGVAYTAIRFIGYSESAALTLLIDAHRNRYGNEWTSIPIDIPVADCGASSSTECGAVSSLVNYTDALFAAYAYQLSAVSVLDMKQLVCYLEAISTDNIRLDGKVILHRLYALTDPESLQSLMLFVNTLETFKDYLEFAGVSHARALRSVQMAISKALYTNGFSDVVITLLHAGTWPNNEYWREELMNATGAALAVNTGLGGETVTGALVQKLLEPALRYVADSNLPNEEDGLREADITDIDAVRALVDQVGEYLNTLRAIQSVRVIDAKVNEQVFLWCMCVSPLDIEVVREGDSGKKCGERYADLCVCEIPNGTVNKCLPLTNNMPTPIANQIATLLVDEQRKRNSTFYYAEKKQIRYTDPVTCCTVVEEKMDVVSGIQSFLDGWESLIIRPKNQVECAQLRAMFAPSQLLLSGISNLPGETPYRFRVDKESLVRALLANPTLFTELKPRGILQGFVPIAQL